MQGARSSPLSLLCTGSCWQDPLMCFFLVASWPCKEVALLVHLQFSVQLNTGINVVFPLALG